jgi:DNA polymerase
VDVFFMRIPNGIEGTPTACPALSPAHGEDILPSKRKIPMAGASSSLKTLREEAAHCRACPLWKNATQTVFGQGPPHAQAMLVGEQPGDKEDLAGKSFVGPAGQMLDRALEESVPAMVRTRTGRDQTRSGGGDGRYRCTKRVREDHAHQQKPWPPA